MRAIYGHVKVSCPHQTNDASPSKPDNNVAMDVNSPDETTNCDDGHVNTSAMDTLVDRFLTLLLLHGPWMLIDDI